ncbi:MAG: thioredoxin family protein [Bacteroidetes bacterium]|nr:thioredoxin family protein [Bacteroidota bacterium]
MKLLSITVLFSLLAISASAGGPGKGYQVGDKVTDFKLKNIDGKQLGLSDFQDRKGVIVVFTCNHCPYAIKYEDRLIDLHSRYGADFPVLAINPNAPTVEDDSYDQMKVRAQEKGFNFPYLLDADQKIAHQFGAERTPHVYLLQPVNKTWQVAYIGAIDDNAGDASAVKTRYLEDALKALKDGKPIAQSTTKAIGCTIKWKQ